MGHKEMTQKEFKSQICTTREQSQRLLEMGLKPETADMTHHLSHYVRATPWELEARTPTLSREFWERQRIGELAHCNRIGKEPLGNICEKDVPAWSFARLLELMPKRIERLDEPDYVLWITNNNQHWEVSYMEDVDDNVCDCLYSICEDELIEACVSMMELLIRNNHLNKDYLK